MLTNTASPDAREFRADVRRARNLAGHYQSTRDCIPCADLSVVRQTSWAFDILAEEGFGLILLFPVHTTLNPIEAPDWRATSKAEPYSVPPPPFEEPAIMGCRRGRIPEAVTLPIDSMGDPSDQ
jgi:hypothetical protein